MRNEAPSIEEISAYCSENNLNVDVEKFYNYYARSNFLYRGAPMDWKSQLEKWDKTEYKSPKNIKKEKPKSERYAQSLRDLKELRYAYEKLCGKTFDIVWMEEGYFSMINERDVKDK